MYVRQLAIIKVKKRVPKFVEFTLKAHISRKNTRELKIRSIYVIQTLMSSTSGKNPHMAYWTRFQLRLNGRGPQNLPVKQLKKVLWFRSVTVQQRMNKQSGVLKPAHQCLRTHTTEWTNSVTVTLEWSALLTRWMIQHAKSSVTDITMHRLLFGYWSIKRRRTTLRWLPIACGPA